MTDIAEAEARLEELLADDSPDALRELVRFQHNEELPAVALSLARAAAKVRDWHRHPFQSGSRSHTAMLFAVDKALADWERLLGEIASGRND